MPRDTCPPGEPYTRLPTCTHLAREAGDPKASPSSLPHASEGSELGLAAFVPQFPFGAMGIGLYGLRTVGCPSRPTPLSLPVPWQVGDSHQTRRSFEGSGRAWCRGCPDPPGSASPASVTLQQPGLWGLEPMGVPLCVPSQDKLQENDVVFDPERLLSCSLGLGFPGRGPAQERPVLRGGALFQAERAGPAGTRALRPVSVGARQGGAGAARGRRGSGAQNARAWRCLRSGLRPEAGFLSL